MVYYTWWPIFYLNGDGQHHIVRVTVEQDQGSCEILLSAMDFISHKSVQHLVVTQKDVPSLDGLRVVEGKQ